MGEREAARKSPGFWPEHRKSQACPFLRQERRREDHDGTQFHCSKECLQTSTESTPAATQPITPPQLVFIRARMVQPVPSHPPRTPSPAPASSFTPRSSAPSSPAPPPPPSPVFPLQKGHLHPSRSEHMPFTLQPGVKSIKTGVRKESSFPLLSSDSSGSSCS